MTVLYSLKKAPPLPYFYYYLPALLFTVTGLGSCIYLSIVHYRNYTDIGFASICAISKTINCDTVAQSSSSILFSIPVAIWGIFAFVLFGWMLINTNSRNNMGFWWLVFILGLICSAIALFYGYISAIKIHSYCIFCLLSYLCFFVITYSSFIVIRRFRIPFGNIFESFSICLRTRSNLLFLALILGSLTLLQWKLPHYWEFSQHPIPKTVSTGRTETGAYWIGAVHPKLTIEEYTDYMCFQCGKVHIYIRNLVNTHPDKIRLVHHNYPMDNLVNPLVKQPFHVGAGQMALLALYAGSKDKFWEMSDELYRIVREGKQEGLDLQKLAGRIGLSKEEILQAFSNPEYQGLLKDDIRQGLIHRISSTPSYVINGKVYAGVIPLEILSELKP